MQEQRLRHRTGRQVDSAQSPPQSKHSSERPENPAKGLAGPAAPPPLCSLYGKSCQIISGTRQALKTGSAKSSLGSALRRQANPRLQPACSSAGICILQPLLLCFPGLGRQTLSKHRGSAMQLREAPSQHQLQPTSARISCLPRSGRPPTPAPPCRPAHALCMRKVTLGKCSEDPFSYTARGRERGAAGGGSAGLRCSLPAANIPVPSKLHCQV